MADECIQLHGGMGFMTVSLIGNTVAASYCHVFWFSFVITGVWTGACDARSQNLPDLRRQQRHSQAVCLSHWTPGEYDDTLVALQWNLQIMDTLGTNNVFLDKLSSL